ncbi:hypothetical protein [Paraburkholderia ginsengisoli]|uniref:Uncharacterized protein n=1 Tax=Paraburkholderia ginsengisoli TaxID=311231 RepID=A0A7T4TCG8_9BURK|nr:hypothetical protein [Paraburkholderia ginsengisoli]QQC67578.1 hypothetical protein I6I06_21990 [Paraburkholderia ginsengisoli]
MDFAPHAAAQASNSQRSQQMIGSRAAEHRQPDRLAGGFPRNFRECLLIRAVKTIRLNKIESMVRQPYEVVPARVV